MSMFYDQAKIYVKAGKGGDGIVAFLREKYRPDGGPAGGDGGRGGSIILKVEPGLRTLADFHFKPHFKAKSGENGQTKSRYGKGAEDLVLSVPPGTVVKDFTTGEVLGDLIENGAQLCVAKGGRGGRGNKKFATHNNPAPEISENGEPGEERTVILELKVLADVGLVGFPSVGKSTLLSVVSNAKPKIADYHFTTLSPNLGLVRLENQEEFVLADLPGLIEGAASGLGLGIQFLRHIERTKVLLHVIDMGSVEGRDPFDDYLKINQELISYGPDLIERPTIIVANKMDIPEAELYLEEFREKLKSYWSNENFTNEIPEIVPISSLSQTGLTLLLKKTYLLLEKALEGQEIKIKNENTIDLKELVEEKPYFYLSYDESMLMWVLSGEKIEKDFKMANLEFDESARRFARKLRAKGVDDALIAAGAKDGDIVRILDYEFEFIG